MPNSVGVYGNPDVRDAGDEVSSTYEGRHVTMLEGELIHEIHTDEMVNKGDPVVFCLYDNYGTPGRGVGVALTSAALITDRVAVDTEGIWALQVYAENDAGDSRIIAGDALFIDMGTDQAIAAGIGYGAISKIRNLVTQVPFGYALGDVATGSDGIIAVKVHWDPEEQQDEFARFQDAHGADDMKKFTLIDEDDNAAGMTRVVAIDGSFTANKTGTANFTGLAVDIAAGGTAQNVYGIEVYMATVGDDAISTVCAYSSYFEDQGNVIGNNMTCDWGRDSVHAALTRDTYIRIREHGAAVLAGSSFLLLEGANAVGYMFNFMNPAGAEDGGFVLEPEGSPQTADYRIRCRLQDAAVDRYIHLHPI